jgi:hypothetical protein
MCGIIGYVGHRASKPLLLQGLKRLEYRGYDSAGIALLEDDGLDYIRSVGPLDNLARGNLGGNVWRELAYRHVWMHLIPGRSPIGGGQRRAWHAILL